MTLLSEGLSALRRGWHIIALDGKKPRAQGWQRSPPPSEAVVEAWARQGNLGVCTGHGFIVVDIDPGADTSALDLPETVEARTGRGGRHLYYRCDERMANSVGRIAEHVDVRGTGGQVVLPGSVHPDTGEVYAWLVHPDEREMADAPAWLAEVARPKEPRAVASISGGNLDRWAAVAIEAELRSVRNAREGTRNNTLNRAAFNLGQIVESARLDPQELLDELLQAADACGLGAAESRATAISGVRAGMQSPRSNATRPRAPDRVVPEEGDIPEVLVPGTHVTDQGEFIEVSDEEFASAAISAIEYTGHENFFRRGGVVLEMDLTSGVVYLPDEYDVRLLISRYVRFARWRAVKAGGGAIVHEKQRVPGSTEYSRLIRRHMRTHPNVRDLEVFAPHPMYVANDGNEVMRARPGYDWQTRVYCTDYTEQDGETCDVDEFLCDFPFATESDRDQFVGLMLTPIVRQLIDGPVPMHLITSTIERTGKTKLAEEVLGGLLLGRPTPAAQLGGNEEEIEKRILAHLLAGPPILHLDNLAEHLDSGALASLLTSNEWKGRMLGRSEVVSIPNRTVIVGTGNNVRASAELAKRIVPIRLEPRYVRPDLRRDFRHPDLRRHVARSRAAVLRTLCGWVDSWLRAERPTSERVLGGYEAWCRVVGGIMECAGRTAWLASRESWVSKANIEGVDLQRVVQLWWDQHGTSRTRPRELLGLCEGGEVWLDLWERARTPEGRTVALGRRLSRYFGREFNVLDDLGRTVRVKLNDAMPQGSRVMWLEPVAPGGGETPTDEEHHH
jgi:hypothetical protein